MNFLYLLEKIRFPLLDKLVLLITELGSMAVFLFVAVLFFWCIDKKKGYYFILVGLVGTTINQFLKLCFRIPRPWVLDENFTIVEAAREGAGGYSFPSGHTQSAVSTYAGIALLTKRRWLRIVAIVIAVLVPFTRMYLGVHTPLDVIVAAVIAILLALVIKHLVFSQNESQIRLVLIFSAVLAAGNLLYALLKVFPTDIDLKLLKDAQENALSLFGATLALPVVYILDRKWIKFPTKAVWWAQVLKIILGLALLLLVKEALKLPLQFLFQENIARIIRYFFVVLTAGTLWPMTFRWFSGLGRKEL